MEYIMSCNHGREERIDKMIDRVMKEYGKIVKKLYKEKKVAQYIDLQHFQSESGGGVSYDVIYLTYEV